MRSEFGLLSLLSLFILSCAPKPSSLKSTTTKPNIIFILTDDLGYGDIGVFYQNERKLKGDRSEPWTNTPNLDQMAMEGTILTDHYTAAPVCAPSRSSLLSGLSQGHANVRDNQFDKDLANNHTLGNVMQKLGYTTAAFGKWGLQGSKYWSEDGEQWPARPNFRGFDHFLGYMRHSDGHEHYPKEGIYRGPKEVWENDKEISKDLDKCYTADLWTAAAKKWISEQANTHHPFFMYLAYDTPHAVLELPATAYPDGKGLIGGIQWKGTAGEMINTAKGEPDSYIHPDYINATYDHDKDPATPEIAWPDTYKRYATAVRRIDDAVGDIIQLLKDLHIDENTMIVFTSDNGPSLESYLPKGHVPNTPDFFDSFGPFDGIKRDVLEGGERMPLIARWPGHIKENFKADNPSTEYDWLPTFTEAAGAPAPANSDGVSLLPVLTGSGEQAASLVYSEYQVSGKTPDYNEFSPNNRNKIRGQMQMIRMGKFSGIRYNIQSANDDFEIYNLTNDPGQSNNLAGLDSMDSLQQAMKSTVLQIRRSDSQAPRPYDSVAVPSVPLKSYHSGLKWRSYNGKYPWLPDLTNLKAVHSGIVSGLEELDLSAEKENLHLLNAYIEVPETAAYTFHFSVNGKGLIRLHKAILFDADYGYKSGSIISTTMLLEKGMHPISIYLENNDTTMQPFNLSWEKNSKGKAEPVTFYYSTNFE